MAPQSNLSKAGSDETALSLLISVPTYTFNIFIFNINL